MLGNHERKWQITGQTLNFVKFGGGANWLLFLWLFEKECIEEAPEHYSIQNRINERQIL